METLKTAPPNPAAVKTEPRVVQEHVSILREIKAPEPLIEIAERVAATAAQR